MKTRRNNLRKRLWIAASILFILLASVAAFLNYRHWCAFRQDIHQDAALIVRINADQIFRVLALDYISQPGYYNDRKVSGTSTGLKIPADVLIYNLTSRAPQTFVSLLEIDDVKQFLKTLASKLRVSRLQKQNGIYSGSSDDGKITLMFDQEQLAISYSLTAEKPWNVLEDLLMKRNLMPKSDSRLKRLRLEEGDVSYLYHQHAGNAYFKDGHIHFSGSFDSQQITKDEHMPFHRKFSKESALKMWLNGRFNFPKSIYFNGMPPIYTDTLLKYYRNQMDAEFIGQVIQRDSVVSYEYNDDFEKIPKISIKKSAVPKIIISLEADPAPIIADLAKQKILLDGAVNKKIFPLYDLYWKTDQWRFQLSTDKNFVLNSEKEKTKHFFGLQVNFDLFLKQSASMPAPKIFKRLSTLTILAEKKDAHRSHFEVDISFIKAEVNALAQIF